MHTTCPYAAQLHAMNKIGLQTGGVTIEFALVLGLLAASWEEEILKARAHHPKPVVVIAEAE